MPSPATATTISGIPMSGWSDWISVTRHGQHEDLGQHAGRSPPPLRPRTVRPRPPRAVRRRSEPERRLSQRAGRGRPAGRSCLHRDVDRRAPSATRPSSGDDGGGDDEGHRTVRRSEPYRCHRRRPDYRLGRKPDIGTGYAERHARDAPGQPQGHDDQCRGRGRAHPRAGRHRRSDRRGDPLPGPRGDLAGTARAKGYDVVAVLGGDGTINETVNGLLNAVNGGSRARTTRARAAGAARHPGRQRERLRPGPRPAEQPDRGDRRGAGGAARRPAADRRARAGPLGRREPLFHLLLAAWGTTPRSSGRSRGSGAPGARPRRRVM